MTPQGYSADNVGAAMQGIDVGVDMDMMGQVYRSHLAQLIKDGKVKEKTLDDAVRNILRLKFKMGLFDNPYVDMANANTFYTDDNLAKAKQAVIESVILLKNEKEVLPLKETVKSVAVIGPMADAPHEQMTC